MDKAQYDAHTDAAKAYAYTVSDDHTSEDWALAFNAFIAGSWSHNEEVERLTRELADLQAAYDILRALAGQYASECGDCAGARVTPDDEPCTQCADVWAEIEKAERVVG